MVQPRDVMLVERLRESGSTVQRVICSSVSGLVRRACLTDMITYFISSPIRRDCDITIPGSQLTHLACF